MLVQFALVLRIVTALNGASKDEPAASSIRKSVRRTTTWGGDLTWAGKILDSEGTHPVPWLSSSCDHSVIAARQHQLFASSVERTSKNKVGVRS